MEPLPRPNAFPAVRWFFALSLVVFHGSVAASCRYGWFVSPHSIISVFFVISGMLTYNSYLLRPGVRAFYRRRVRRIVPAYAAVVVLAAVAGAFVTVLPVGEYLTSTATFKYLAANLAFLNFMAPGLPGVFESNTVTAVNSSLWTMKVEVAFYVLLPAIVHLTRRLGPLRVIAALYLLSVAWNVAFAHAFGTTGNGLFDMLRRQLPGQLMYFAAGMAAVHLSAPLLRHRGVVAVCAIAVWVACDRHAALRFLEPAAIAAALVAVACTGHRLATFAVRLPDLTYEVYLLHFPVIQLLVASGFFATAGFPVGIIVAVAIILLLAAALHSVCRRL